MAKDFTSGASPEHLKRLLFAGLDEAEADVDAGSPASLQDWAEGPGTRIGHYRLVRSLGEGGMGIVYLAEQERPIKRQVALKIIKPGMDSKQVIARIESERQALALLDHPNIAHVYDAGTTAGRPYFVMEYIQGVPITEHCDQQKLTIEQRLQLFLGVCEAIQHAHQKGIIHRDIKPSNILVHMEGDRAVPKVIDFGIAKAMSQALTERTLVTEQGHFVGTPEYMSPEQAQASGQDTDTRSDIYSLGVVLYELLAGVLPFDPKALRQGGPDHARKVIREEEPRTPSRQLTALGKTAEGIAANRQTEVHALSRRLHKELEWIPLKAMRKDPARRYRSASELADDIRNYLNGRPLITGPETVAYRVQKFVRRNRVVVGAGAAVIAVLVLGIVGSTWQAMVATRARSAAEAAQKQADAERQRAERLLYAANMNLAQQAWEQGNGDRVRQLLSDSATYPDRGFEWYYLQRQAHQALKTFHGHTASIWSLALSPDGRKIVTGSEDTTAKVWDLATGEELLTLRGHGAEVYSVAFSPDGQRIVTGSMDQTARVWDTTSGRRLVILKHGGAIGAVAFSPDGQRIVTGGNDRMARVWDAASGGQLLALKGSDRNWIRPAVFSPDGRRILTGSWDQTAKVWDAVSGQQLLALSGHSDDFKCVAYSPDGQRIVTGSRDCTAKVWEAASGRELLTFKGHGGSVDSAAFSQDGRRLVTGSADGTAKVWEADTGKELLTLRGHGAAVTCAEFFAGGQRIVTGSFDNTVKIWDTTSINEPLIMRGHEDKVMCVALSPDGRRLATASDDHTAKIWDTVNGKELLTLKGHRAQLRSVAFSPDGSRIATASLDNEAKVWDAASGKELHTLAGHRAGVHSVAFSPDGQRIVTGSIDRTAKVWDAATGKELLTLSGHRHWLHCAAYSPDGQRIVTGSWDYTAKVWDAASGKELLTFEGHRARVLSAAFSRDGQRIVTGSYDRTAKVWEAASGKELLTLEGHSNEILSVAFSPDGKRIVTASGDGTAKLWEATSGKELLTLRGHSYGLEAVTFSPDGRRVATGSDDQTARIWDVATADQVATWQKEERAAADHMVAVRCELKEHQAAEQRERAAEAEQVKGAKTE
jgi:eukaryotic-like serine/threonine-protein kinase